jgi:hypothetical protein
LFHELNIGFRIVFWAKITDGEEEQEKGENEVDEESGDEVEDEEEKLT